MSQIHFITLGCPKNRVDAEHMLGSVVEAGHEITQDVEEADTIVINTCSFIGEAKEESINMILSMAEVKKRTQAKLVVSGCLAQRYASQLEEELPEIDMLIGTSDYLSLAPALSESESTAARAGRSLNILKSSSNEKPLNAVSRELKYVATYDIPRQNSMQSHTAYLKIAEGCDNTCAFCIIPKLRGKQRSRTIEDLVHEANRLASEGVWELNLIAQDLTGYGHDLPKQTFAGGKERRPNLADLLEALSHIEGIRWVRSMYAYPRTLSDELMHQLAHGRNILPYLDIPTQHGSDRMLRRMKRGKDQKRLSAMMNKVREQVPGVILRSTVIVGFPGEEEEDFIQLEDFVESVRFERLGVFQYSDEEDTAAFDLDGKLEQDIIEDRHEKLMLRQQAIHKAHLEKMVGTFHEAVVEGESDEYPGVMTGRLWSQAPEIDGVTYFSSEVPLEIGQHVIVRIEDVREYDVLAEVIEADDIADIDLPIAPFG